MTALIANRTRPSLTPRIEVVPCQGKEVIAVEVPPQSAPVGTTSGRYLRRALDGKGRPCCLPMFFHEMHARLRVVFRFELYQQLFEEPKDGQP